MRTCLRILPFASVLLLSAGTLQAQLDPTAAVGAWTVTITSSGGFAGRTSSVTVTSDGKASCDPTPCVQAANAARLRQIDAAVQSAAAEEWTRKASRFGTCYDCQRTTMTLERREPEGVRTYTANWTGLEGVAPAVRELARVVSVLGSHPVR